MKKHALFALLASTTLFARPIDFVLKAHVFDDGQKVTAVELDTHGLNIDRAKLTARAFSVHAKGTLPIDARQNNVFGEVNHARPIQRAFINRQGNIELLFANEKGANTLAYIGGSIARNTVLNLDYQISLQAVDFLPSDTTFRQAGLVDREVSRFISKTSKEGIHYQFFPLQNPQEKRPLIVWLHGNGEGGIEGYYNNQSQLLANRGGVAFTTPEVQKIFGGAYVIAPQAPDTWYNNYRKNYIGKIKQLIDEVVAENHIDPARIYLFGASAGGYMAMRLLIEYPETFAGANVSASALDKAPLAGGVPTTAGELAKIKHKPLWLVHAANDPTISYSATSKRVFQTLREDGAILTVYPEVKIGQKSYNGHWSWIYSLHNQPTNPQGEHLFQWMAKQHLN